eukprot:m.407159 g.407159  ORF g.407159 m.407159 type:complete len:1693 (-) comp28441_c0_seq1:7149-12227(-)
MPSTAGEAAAATAPAAMDEDDGGVVLFDESSAASAPASGSTAMSSSDTVGEDNELPAYNHLYGDDDEPIWTISAQEARFYELLRRDHPAVYVAALKLRKSRNRQSCNRPIDLFGLREFVRKHFEEVCKKRPTLAPSTAHVTGCEALDALRAQRHPTGRRTLKKEYREMMWTKIRTSDPDLTLSEYKFLEDAYVTVIVPFEKEFQFAEIHADGLPYGWLSPIGKGKVTPAVDVRVGEAAAAAGAAPTVSTPIAVDDIDTVRTMVAQCLGELSDDVLPQMTGEHQSAKVTSTLEQLDKDIGDVLQPLGTAGGDDWASSRTIPIVGQAGQGKSTILNDILAVTEVPEKLYNYNRDDATDAWTDNADPGAHHAAEIVARIICRDRVAAGVECDFHEISRSCLGVADVDGAESRDGYGRRVILAAEKNVMHELPSGPPPVGEEAGASNPPIFNADGRLSADCKDVGDKGKVVPYGARLAAVVSANEGFRAYCTETRNVTGDFLLPNKEGGKSVTSFNTYIHGGDQYAAVIKYLSTSFVRARLSALETILQDGGLASKKSKNIMTEVLTLAFAIGEGLRPDDETEKAYTRRRKDWMHDVGKRDGNWATAVEDALDKPHPSTSQLLGTIWMIEGAGRRGRVVDDRVYIQTRLAAVLDASASVLIEEVHLVAPSDILDPEFGGVLVDTPGLGDPNVMRLHQTERAVNERSGLIICSENAMSRGAATTTKALCDLGVVSELAADVVLQHRGKPVAFVFNPEKAGIKAKAVPAKAPNSVLGGDPDLEPEELKRECVEDAEEVLTDALSALAEEGDNEINGVRPPAGDEFTPSYLAETMAGPIVSNNVHYIFPSLHRGIDLGGLPDVTEEERGAYEFATGMPTLLRKIESMCRDGRVLTADAVQPIMKQLATLKADAPTFAKAPRTGVPQTVKVAAAGLWDQIEKRKQAQPGQKKLAAEYKLVITESLKPGHPGDLVPTARGRTGAETEWVREAARALVTVCREQVPKSWAVLTRESRSGISVPKMEHFQRVADLCREGVLFDEVCAAAGQSTLAKDVWSFCKAAPELDVQNLWKIVVKRPLGTTIDAGLRGVYAPVFAKMIFSKISPETDVTEESLVALLLENGEHGLSILNHAFDVRMQTKNLNKQCSNKIGNWSWNLTHFHKTDSLFRRVLNSVFQKIFKEAPKYEALQLLNAQDLVAVLDKLVSEEALDDMQAYVEKLLQGELDTLFELVCKSLKLPVIRTLAKNICCLIAKTSVTHGDGDDGSQQENDLEARFNKSVDRLVKAQKQLRDIEVHDRAECANRRRVCRMQLQVPWDRSESERLATDFKMLAGHMAPPETVDPEKIDDLLVGLCDPGSTTALTETELNASFPGHSVDSIVLPHKTCVGELQLFSLLRQTVDDQCDLEQLGDRSPHATEMRQFLVDVLRTKPHKPLHGALAAFVKQFYAHVEILCSTQKDSGASVVVLRPPESVTTVGLEPIVVRLLYNSHTGGLYLVRHPKKRRHAFDFDADLPGTSSVAGAPVAIGRSGMNKRAATAVTDGTGVARAGPARSSVRATSGKGSKRSAADANLSSNSKRRRQPDAKAPAEPAVVRPSRRRADLPKPPPGSGFRVRLSVSENGRPFFLDKTLGALEKGFWCDEPHTWEGVARRNQERSCAEARAQRGSASPAPVGPSTAAAVLADQMIQFQARQRRPKSKGSK